MTLPKFLNKSINTRVVFLVSSLLVGSMIIIALFAVSIIYMSMSTQTSILLDSRVHSIHKRIEQRLFYSIEDTEKLTKNELMINSLTDADGREEYLPALVKNFMLGKNVISLNIVDFDGKPIFKTQERIPLYNESENLRNTLAVGNTDFYIEEDSGEFVVVSPIEYYGTTQGAAIVVFNLPKIIDNNFPDNKYTYIALLQNERKIYSRNFTEGESYQVSRINIKSDTSIFNQLGLSLELGIDSEVYVAPVKDVIYKLLVLSLLLILVGVLLARFLANSITNPILELYKRVTSPNISGMSFCSPLDTEDELEELAKAFDKRTLMLQHQAEHDALTALPNRVLFIDRVKENIKTAKENNSSFAVLFLDLDHFKEVNDSFGHEFGDELLLLVAKYLETVLSERDSVARMGGDEFTILLSDIKSINAVIRVLEKVMQLFQEPFNIHHEKFYVTCSIGIAIYPVHGNTSELLLKNADAAMYKAKDEGRNTYKFYTDDMTQKAYERILLEKELREAIRNREFEVYYQPQVNMETKTIIGMEALVRWNHPEKGLVSPVKFIPLAEETGLIIDIDKQVMRDAMFQFQEWIEDGYDVGTLSLNLSMLQLNYEGFFEFVQETVNSAGISTSHMIFEVTETQVMKNPENAIMIFKQLKALGIRLAVDDFGTGHSSLSYLKQLPIDKLKIDQSFTRDVIVDKSDAELTRAIISIAKSLHLEIIAEGVETHEQRTFLVENGCVEAQGYLYYKPQKSEDITKILLKI
jgi:diguanylate cyclase (GGDEF)-like protein